MLLFIISWITTTILVVAFKKDKHSGIFYTRFVRFIDVVCTSLVISLVILAVCCILLFDIIGTKSHTLVSTNNIYELPQDDKYYSVNGDNITVNLGDSGIQNIPVNGTKFIKSVSSRLDKYESIYDSGKIINTLIWPFNRIDYSYKIYYK